MKYRRLGKTELKISVIGIGTWQFGGEWGKDFSQHEVNTIFSQAKEQGINLIDTAECYGDHLSEQLIGEFIKQDRRQDWVIASKFGHCFHEPFQRSDHWKADEVIKQLDASLQALQTDYIDLYQFHSGNNEQFDNDELWSALAKQVEAGKIRHLGISIGGNNLHQTKRATEVGAKTIQLIYNRLERTPEEEILPACDNQDLGVLARVPLASGYLSGKYKPGATFQESDVRHRHDVEEVSRKLQEVERISREEVPEQMDMAQWALAWCLRHDAVSCVIPGCKNPDQVLSNAKAADYVNNDHKQAWTQ